MEHVEIREDAAPQAATAHNARRWKERCRQIHRVAIFRDLNLLPSAASDHHQRQSIGTFSPSTRLHGQSISDFWPEAAKRIPLEPVGDSGTVDAACTKECPRTIEPVGHRMFASQRLLLTAAIDALSDLACYRSRDEIEIQVLMCLTFALTRGRAASGQRPSGAARCYPATCPVFLISSIVGCE